MKQQVLSVALAVGSLLSSTTAHAAFSANPGVDFWDYGDAPASYGDARHANGTLEWLGMVAPDYENVAQPGDGTPDDTTGTAPDDEDGVVFLGSFNDQAGTDLYDPNWYVANKWGKVDVTMSVADHTLPRYQTGVLYLDAWFDWGHDGVFDEGAEHVISEILDPSTWMDDFVTESYTFSVAPGPTGPFYARFRLNYDEGVNAATGDVSTGEVEDYGCSLEGGGACHGQIPLPATFGLMPLGGLLAGLFGVMLARRRVNA